MRLQYAWFTLLHFLSPSFSLPLQVPPTTSPRSSPLPDLPRLVIYYQTTHDSLGNPISMLPLVTEKNIALTHLIICSLHINPGSTIHLNDHPPSDPHFTTLWAEARVLADAGVRVMGMIGGAAPGSFTAQTLDAPPGSNSTAFEHYYGQLRDVIRTYGLGGLDLDVEQSMSQAGITRLVERLYADFGPGFVVTLAPVASALENGGNLSGFDYGDLEAAAGDEIGFYNAQFYNGFGSMASTAAFDGVVANGWEAEKIVVGQITTPDNGGQYVSFDVLNRTIGELRGRYGEIGGIMGWEYFNSQPGGTAEPWEWAQRMTEILRPEGTFNLTVTRETAEMLEGAWRRSVLGGSVQGVGGQYTGVLPDVDYMAMVNS
ncbi:coagulation factor 5/8 type domain protein [Coniochaeta ligniaria NRRL 30616]|uniref:Coagulation factor 5/8 type domain protein n=1 Tax=Coniochaeta ligniaria NRRL 30616 TaxID=1408157 RepID=A0A1J7JSG7_9PEZI|nr:coagulation factor 5/8 type domain protein [Coniochaeta ligniaria NRRL 30616]